MKKLIFLMPNLSGGGAEHVLVTLLKYLDRSRFEVTLLLLFKEGPLLNEIPDSVKVQSIFKKAMRSSLLHYYVVRFVLKYLRSLLAIIFDLRFASHGYDCALAFLEGHTHDIVAMSRARVRKIAWVHSSPRARRTVLGHNGTRRVLSAFDRVVFVSESLRSEYIQLFGVRPEKSITIYNPIDIDRVLMLSAEQLHEKYRHPQIVSVGRLDQNKNHELLIEALSLLRRDGVKATLLLLGDGPLRERLKSIARSIGVGEAVHLLGFMPNPYPVIRVADVFALPSFSEGFPTVICEAMVLGKRIVCSDMDVARELLAEYPEAILAKPNPDAFKNGLRAMLERSSKPLPLSPSTVSIRFDISRQIGAVEALFLE
jgi:glycosyltransferase involved in cell wall biosynthesis